MEWDLGATLACAAIGAVGGALVPRIVASLPEPVPDPEEKAGDFPDKVPYVDLAARRRLLPACVVACAIAGALLGGCLGWSWGLPWLLFLLPVGAALTVIDYVTWYLPARIITPSYAVVAALVVLAAAVDRDLAIAVSALVGGLALGGYYGVLWFVSPRIMAFGDVRLGALLGLALGPFGAATVVLSVLLAAVTLLLALLPMRLLGHTIEQEEGVVGTVGRRHLPFGPFLVLGALLAVVLGRVLAAA
jgi:leader peptidase (prepilin peptidase)/N-methyltransferase